MEYTFNNANNGFGAGHNIIMKEQAKLGKYHFVLNPDISFKAAVLENLVEFMDANEDVGLCMPMVRYPRW
ncbi:MAG: hypothetical protein VYB44_18375 [Bacteroidota bacterium]|nr:hypothetical protein [Bacteroidota bacterium]